MTSGPPSAPVKNLNERSREIFRRIVENYLITGDPLGSKSLASGLSAPLSPASIRNVMSDLENMGLLYSPHTSAGRLPTETGLRLFVDGLLEIGDLTKEEREQIAVQIKASERETSFENVLTEASQMLSGLSQGAGVVLATKQDVTLRHVEFVRIEPLKALVVLVSEDGSVENRVIDLPPGLPQSALVEAGNYLTSVIRSKTLTEAKAELEKQQKDNKAELDKLSSKLVEQGIALWSGEQSHKRSLIVRGRSNLLQNVGAEDDLERIRLLFDDFENKSELIKLLELSQEGEGVRIFIGSENNLFSLSGSSVVVSPYRDSEQRILGVLGVIGPTRLNYARVIPMVDYTARLISRILG
ncbi:heat-inducible transcriptional repressor HrcA [Flexibacterium corallicola]|uniref:heat-inducible transcriptional repressor HrcA n=1 Tax=Flexibacterium corallicola TaxID=3037259 RepID=UPI00286F1B07|nr:heat-inducible transcriptional repressor HrcA [Pseudovibrio sp. M1P-2-3]